MTSHPRSQPDIMDRLRGADERKCPWDSNWGNKIKPETPCPVCGDCGDDLALNKPSYCVASSTRVILREAADEIERLRSAAQASTPTTPPEGDDMAREALVDGDDPLWALFYKAFWASMKEHSGTEPTVAAFAGFRAVVAAFRAAPAADGAREADHSELLEILDEEGRDGNGACKVAANLIRSLLAPAPAVDAQRCGDEPMNITNSVRCALERHDAGHAWEVDPEDVARLLAAYDRLTVPRSGVQTATVWQPIETAPKDGTLILVFCNHHDGEPEWQIAHWMIPVGKPGPFGHYIWKIQDGGGSIAERIVTHWMPLPAAPSLSSAHSRSGT